MLRVGGSVFIKAASSNPAVTIQAGAVQATAFGLGKNAGSELELALPAGGNQFMTGTISNDAVVHNAYTQNALFLGVGSGATSLSLDSLNVTLNSYGSLNLKQARLVSMRTAASLDSTTLAVNELAFMITGSAATMALRSAGTVWYFASSFSTKG